MAFHIGKNCTIDPTAQINVKEGYLGDGAVIRAGVIIEGTRVEIGREAFFDRGASIGGGSCFDPGAFIKAGDWLHMGTHSHINSARGVSIGHEFGCGIETKIFTHGAYIDSYNLGAPVQWEGVEIGDNVWMPNAWVNPGVKIGSSIVVAARSLVNKNLPTGCLAGGVPVAVIKETWLPKVLSSEAKTKLVETIMLQAQMRLESRSKLSFEYSADILKTEDCEFDLKNKTIHGMASPWTRLVKDQLRRNGIRFRYTEKNGAWISWSNSQIEI